MPDESLAEIPEPANPLSPTTPQALNQPKLLLGEGDEEVFFFNALLKHLNIRNNVQIESYGGKDNLKNFLVTLPKRPGFLNIEAVGITRDADTDAQGAFQSVGSALARAGLPKPQTVTMYTAGMPRIGVFVLPDGQSSGMLEDLCLAAVVADLAMPCVDEYFRCVETAGRVPNNMAKARVHAWLASQVKPDKRLGEAAQAGYWDWHDPAFDLLNQFLQQL